MTAIALKDQIGILYDLFVDDTGMAGDDFDEKLNRPCKFMERVREKRLSLSPQKTKLFMTEAVFAGARVGREGVRPDLAKLSAVADWAVPQTLHNLMQFLGL
ncbi:hypothetical protein BV22DRAFT_1022350, partial [Leucogyrophana mollusca]